MVSVKTLLSLSVATVGLSFFAPAQAVIPPPGADGKYTLTAPGIRAQFIPYAASISNLFVKDKNGIERDIVLGYDHASEYPLDPNHPVYGAVPGRYAGRIGNATFMIDGKRYYTERNDGNSTLHSGTKGWSYRFFNVTAVSETSITFSMSDPKNSTGMPGKVEAFITYRLSKNAWHVEMNATADAKTPLMLTQHTYWNLDAFSNPTTDLIWDHSYYTPFSKRLLALDDGAVPTGKIPAIPKGDINDFWSASKKLGTDMGKPQWDTNCGGGCEGYNGVWVVDQQKGNTKAVASLSSDWTGIKVDIHSEQVAMVLYTCRWMNGKIPIKKTQGGPSSATNGFVKRDGCVALEAQDWSDGINHPEWGRQKYQITGPGDVYKWEATYNFGLL